MVHDPHFLRYFETPGTNVDFGPKVLTFLPIEKRIGKSYSYTYTENE